MRINFYLILIPLLFSVLCSCTKGDLVKDPQFGTVSISNFALGNINVIQGKDQSFPADGTKKGVIAGQSQFRFYESDKLLLDTALSVEPFVEHAYIMFRPTTNTDLKIYDSSLNGLNKEPLPDSGAVKISLANFSATLPNKVNIYLTTTTYILNNPQEIRVAEFINVDRSFSGFKKIVLGKDLSSLPQKTFSMSVKDPVDNKLLETLTIILPGSSTGALLKSVYLLYIDANSSPTILMSK